MANSNPSVTLITQPFILSYPKLFKPEPYIDQATKQPKGEPQFTFEAISELDDLLTWDILDKDANEFIRGSVEKRLVALAREKWGDDFDVKAAVQHGGLTWPFKSGDKRFEEKGEKANHYKGKKFWRAKALAEINGNPNAPALYCDDGKSKAAKLLRGTEAGKARIAELFYGGAICIAELNAVAGTTGDNKYVTFYVNSVVFKKDGERLGGGSHMERLLGVKGGETAYDPTQGMSGNLDDEIPF